LLHALDLDFPLIRAMQHYRIMGIGAAVIVTMQGPSTDFMRTERRVSGYAI
jgi:hypothetical protein